MTSRRLFIHSVFLLLLPLIVVIFGVSLSGTLALIICALIWRWLITLSGILVPEEIPEIELETIAASHFVEKVRWCMDRLGIDYTERQWIGVLGVFSKGRSVPELKVRTGIVRSHIGNSPQILRYLWGAYAVELGEKAKFLEPTRERIALEKKFDRYGVNLQTWVYYHVLDDRDLSLHAWGCNSPEIPTWQRFLVPVLYPVLKVLLRNAFHISPANYTKSVQHIEQILAETELLLADGRVSILGDESINYVDIAFASMSALWLQPPEFGREKADNVRVERQQAPVAMQADIERWIKAYPLASGFVRRLYESQRNI